MNRDASDGIIAIPQPEGLFLIGRRSQKAVSFPLGTSVLLRDAIKADSPEPPLWLREAMDSVGFTFGSLGTWRRSVCMRERPELGFKRVAWEITQRCNFRCVHCYLDDKTKGGLPVEARLRVLDKIERAGCLWLQMTGGEALADPLFGDTYKAAYERGLQVSLSTNGTLLTRWMELFRKLPPRRITMSLYGASPDAYAAMTGACGDHFKTVIAGLDAAIAAHIPLRVSIIAANPNVHEVDTMEGMMRERGVEYHTYWNLTPTLAGKRHPTEIAVKNRRVSTFFQEKTSCAGGTSSLHIQASGRASPCKLLPHISVDLLNDDLSRLSRLCHHPGTKPVGPGCEKCASSANCVTCAPVYALHKKAGHIPRNVCSFRPVAAEGGGCGDTSH